MNETTTPATWRDYADQLTPQQTASLEGMAARFADSTSVVPPAVAAATLATWASDYAAGNDADTRYASVPVPPGATADEWNQRTDGTGWERAIEWPCPVETGVDGTAVDIAGYQNADDGQFTRAVILWADDPVTLTAAQARQLARALMRAAEALDRLDDTDERQREQDAADDAWSAVPVDSRISGPAARR